jgi:3-oxoacyl-[acyl-carrier-protein] synthase II
MSRQPRRVVITGLGAVTTLGADLERSAAALRRGGAAPPTGLAPAAPGERPQIATVPDFEPGGHFSAPKALKLCDRRSRLAVAAASMALADAGLAAAGGAPEGREIGVVLGTSSSDPLVEDLARPLAQLPGNPPERAAEDVSFFAERILARLHPLWLLVQLPNMASAHVAIQLGLQGPNSTIMTDWAAGAQAIGEAYRWVQNGEAEAVLAGGADTGATQLAQISYRQCGLFTGRGASHEPPLAEGAAVLVLEERCHALARGATVHGEIVGYAAAGEPHEFAAPGAGGLARAMRQALGEAGWEPASIACLLPGGTASEGQRQAEEQDLLALGCAPPLCRFDPTPSLGHALAAQAPIALSLALALPVAGARLLCNSVGLLGQAVGLAIARTAHTARIARTTRIAATTANTAGAGPAALPGAGR